MFSPSWANGTAFMQSGMKLFILSDDFSGDGPVWMNIFWPHYTAYAASAPTVLMSTPYQQPAPGRLGFYLQNRREKQGHGDRLCDQVRREKDPDGPNILIVWALNIRDIVRARLLEPVWDQFDHTVLWVLDTINPEYIRLEDLDRFDQIASICADMGADFETRTGKTVLYMPPHTDVLQFGTHDAFRPLDLMVIGRREEKLYNPIHLHFNQRSVKRISADLRTRTKNFSATPREECQILMNAYARSKIAFCFEASNSHPRFRGYSPLTERWAHAWASGCTVVGRKPTGRGADAQMDWPEATLELPETPDDSIAYLETLLEDTEGLERRRIRNVAEAAKRHDTRHRFQQLLTALDIAAPEKLEQGLNQLEQMSDKLFEHVA
jgi:hypothetical protein